MATVGVKGLTISTLSQCELTMKNLLQSIFNFSSYPMHRLANTQTERSHYPQTLAGVRESHGAVCV